MASAISGKMLCDDGGVRDLDMTGHGTDADDTVFERDAAKVRNLVDINRACPVATGAC